MRFCPPDVLGPDGASSRWVQAGCSCAASTGCPEEGVATLAVLHEGALDDLQPRSLQPSPIDRLVGLAPPHLYATAEPIAVATSPRRPPESGKEESTVNQSIGNPLDH